MNQKISRWFIHKMSVRILSIEGNIAAGKSTFMERLKEKYASNDNVVFLDEPVEMWESIKDKEGVSMLEKFYSNHKKYAFAFQMMAFISRLSILKEKLEELKGSAGNKVIITERSVHTDKCVFAQMLFDDGMIEDVEFQIYNKWFDEFSIKQIDKVVMLQSTPEVSYERVIKRGRPGEVIPLEYLQKCGDYHTRMLQNMEKLIIDANVDIYESPKVLHDWINQTEGIVQSFLATDIHSYTYLCLFLYMCVLYVFAFSVY